MLVGKQSSDNVIKFLKRVGFRWINGHIPALFLSCINVLFSTEPILVELCLKTTFYEKQRQVIIPTTKYFLFDAKIITRRKNTDRLNEWKSVVLPWQDYCWQWLTFPKLVRVRHDYFQSRSDLLMHFSIIFIRSPGIIQKALLSTQKTLLRMLLFIDKVLNNIGNTQTLVIKSSVTTLKDQLWKVCTLRAEVSLLHGRSRRFSVV